MSIRGFFLRSLTKLIFLVLSRLPPPTGLPDYLAIKDGEGIKAEWISPTPELIVGELKGWADTAEVESIRIPGYWMERGGNKGKDVPPAAPGEKVLFVLHGGGFAADSAHPSDLTANLTSGVLKYTKTISRAFSLEYRLSKDPQTQPANPFPAALLDTIAGYDHLVNVLGFLPENVILEGDSAGANLGLALTRYLLEGRERDGVKLPAPPGALILNSPWIDLTGSDHKDGSSVFANRATDFLDPTAAIYQGVIHNYVGKATGHEAGNNRFISPGAQTPEMEKLSFANFPRTFISCGGREVMRDQIRVLKERMKRDLGDMLTYHEMPEAHHDTLIFRYFEPERSTALKKIGEWIDL